MDMNLRDSTFPIQILIDPSLRRWAWSPLSANEAPTLNWIYVDRETQELKYGNRTQSREHAVGSWGWDTSDEDGSPCLVLEGNEAAIAIQTLNNSWELWWAEDVDRIRNVGKKIEEVSLERKVLTEESQKMRRNETNVPDRNRPATQRMDSDAVGLAKAEWYRHPRTKREGRSSYCASSREAMVTIVGEKSEKQ